MATSRKRKPFSQITGDETNSILPKKSKSQENDYQKRAGTVNHMILKNFMCHSLLEVKFENNVSFVIGKNGSGKSAILTALIIGLGGKATLTNRGNAVKSFVKAGKQSATIEIELCNEGPMAYRPNVYGNTIHIIRNLNANGGGSYRIKSANGEIISTQAREVHSITVSLNIQVDNPVCILNQDTSRNFLNSNNPKNKFTLFMKATKLESLEAEYNKIQINKKESVRIMTEKTENFRKLQEEIKFLKIKIDNHRSIISLKDDKTLLQRELVWAKVRDIEDELQGFQNKLDESLKKLNDFKEKCSKRVETLQAFKEEVLQLEQQLLEIHQQIKIQKRPQIDLRMQIDELNRNVSSKEREKQGVITSIQNNKADIDTLQKDISSSKENMSKVEQQKLERIQNLTSLQDKLKNLDSYLETSKNDLFQVNSDLSHRKEDEKNLNQEINKINTKIENENNNLKALISGSGNELLLYHREMPKIKQMISQYSNKFKHEPRGPLGSYIKLKDKKWTVAVEGYLTPAVLRAFAVDNKQDSQLLREIFNRCLGSTSHPQIITSKFIFQKHNVSRYLTEEPKDCVSVYNAIEIDDPIVSNCIVDNCNPESILLIPSDDRTQKLLSNQQYVPKNCNQGVTIKGDRYYPDPNYRTYASAYNRAQYLQVDTKEHIYQLQQSIEHLKKTRETVNNQLNALRTNIREQTTKLQQLEEKVRKVNQARTQIRNKLKELELSVEPEVQNVQHLEQELDESKKALNKKAARLETVKEEIKEIRSAIDEKEQQLSQLRSSSTDLQDRIEHLDREIREKQTKQKEISASEKFDQETIDKYEAQVKKARSAVVGKQNDLQTSVEEASSVGERLEHLRDIPKISNEITAIKNKINKIEMDTEQVGDIIVKYTELSEKLKKSVDIMKSLENDISELTLAVEKRNRHYKLTESYFVTFMKYSFKKILEYRQFKGNIDINVREKQLELIVIPQHGSQGHTITSNLSGGERSFSTVAFLYALWQCMELPFYFLDEFDVFMDKLNRTKVINILLHHAKTKPELQFVFLTPQDVSFIDQNVSILRLEDPQRIHA